MLRIITFFITLIIAFIIAEFYFNFLSHSFNKLRYLTLYNGGKSCIEELKNYSKNFKSLGSFKKGQCRVNNAVRVKSYNNTKLSGDVTLSCPTAVKVGKYLNEIRAKTITHTGSYNCRTIARSKIYSEHSYGTALDISDIDGANVKIDWNKNTEKGQILKKAYKVACNYFNNILTPDSDQAHHDHFHFDNGFGLKCYFKSIIK